MRIFVLPVSGGGFPVQLGLISELTSVGITPKVVFGSSGGNVAGYLGLSADWSPHGIRRIVEQLHPDLFSRSWWPKMLSWMPSWTIGYFRGSVYGMGEGVDQLIDSIFTSQTIQTTEIWTGTKNRSTGRGQLFCNRRDSQLPVQDFDPHLINCMPLTYIDGDLPKLAKVILASASIPILVPEQEIDGEMHVDGGTAFASPLTPLQDVLRQVPDLHLDYLSSFDALSCVGNRTALNLYQNGEQTAHEVVGSLILHDRMNAIEIIRDRRSGQELHYQEGDCDLKTLQDLEILRSTSTRSILELYPVEDMSIDLTKFLPSEIHQIIDSTRKNYRYRLWYQTPSRESQDVTDCWFRR